ncbi:MAG TPA: hypothetical protein VGQ95_00275 [Chthoniobacterales bacterium]|nr:hypothetical protein [Chthoniobacterales bacterium]
MNGAEPKIEIFKPFGEAFELMKRILFQPFELKKWLVIGFAAFLAHLGAGFNFNYNYGDRSQLPQELSDAFHQIPLWIIVVGATFGIVLIITIAVVFAWLRARGRFIFIDCIVKNRAAIVQPWREFREQGNSYFLFSLLIGCSFFLFAALLSLPFLLPIVRGVTFPHLHDVYLISVIVLWAVVIFLLVFAWALVAHLMVAIMYRRRCRVREAFSVVVSLISAYPAEIVLYCLFWVVLGLASIVVSCTAICATCCIAAIPYVGTVVLLPVFVVLRSFSLRFLRQFGPDYDVWATLPQPEAPAIPPPLPA